MPDLRSYSGSDLTQYNSFNGGYVPLFEPGQKVTYHPLSGFHMEKGIVKSLCDDPHYVFVVYHCDNKWDDYQNYTAARTYTNDLLYGWPDEPDVKIMPDIIAGLL